jgi:hypothetical protein
VDVWEADALPTELFPLDAIILLPLFEPVNAPERPNATRLTAQKLLLHTLFPQIMFT